MRRIYAKHEPYWETGHLAEVIQELRIFGSPTIRCAEFQGKLFALEGSHRLAGCDYLKICPKVVIEPDEIKGSEEFWSKVIDTLPYYDFEYVYRLEL